MEIKNLDPPVPRNDWPDTVTAPELSRLMGPFLGEHKAYALFQSGAFPVMSIGKLNVVKTVDFFSWFDGDRLRERFIRESSGMWEGDSLREITMRFPRRPKDIRTFEAE